MSISRFGDGEIKYCLRDRPLAFQPWYPVLAERLETALFESNASVLATYNHYLASMSEARFLSKYTRYDKPVLAHETLLEASDIKVMKRSRSQNFYRRYWRVVSEYTRKTVYGETSVFALEGYVAEYARGEMETVIDLFRRLFNGRRILFVAPDDPLGGPSFRALEPAMRKMGLRASEYISIPAIDAFAGMADIERMIRTRKGFDDIFIQAGPLATVLAHELAGKIGERVLDVGSLNTQVPYLVDHNWGQAQVQPL